MTESERVRATLCHHWLSTHDIRVKAKIGARHAGLLKAYLRDMVKSGELEHRHVEWTPGRWCDEWRLKGYAWDDFEEDEE